MRYQNKSKQSGVAIIIAMMISAVVVALSVKASWQFELGISRSANGWLAIEQEVALSAVEDYARWLLKADLQNPDTQEIDSLSQLAEANSILQLEPTEGVFATGLLEDAHARLNLNNLQRKQNSGTGSGNNTNGLAAAGTVQFTPEQKMLIRLLQTVEIEPAVFLQEFEATAIVESLIDYLDADNTPTGFGGAEEDYYASLEPPLVIANRKMLSVSEFLLIKGMTPVLYKALLPFVTVLPEDTLLNVNTMPIELMRAINDDSILQPQPFEALQSIALDRPLEGYNDVAEFLESPGISTILTQNQQSQQNQQGNAAGGSATAMFTVKSDYFFLFGQVQLGEHIGRSRVMLKRAEDNVQVLRRSDANF